MSDKNSILQKLKNIKFDISNTIADIDELIEDESVPGNKSYRFDRGNTERARRVLVKALEGIYQAVLELRARS